jgi:K+-transporting ATPase KdpF subunit
MTLLTWVGLIIAIALFIYLCAALLKPELFE